MTPAPHHPVDVARACQVIEAYGRAWLRDDLVRSSKIVLDAYRELLADRLPEPVPVRRRIDWACVAVWLAVGLSGVCFVGLAVWAVIGR